MERLAKAMSRSQDREARAIAFEAHASTVGRNPMHFVWDLVTCDAPYTSLKYVRDALQPPSRDTPDFEKRFGLKRHLTFEPRQILNKKPLPVDLFQGVY